MKRSTILAGMIVAASMALTASAAENAPVARGTGGLLEVPFRADNEGTADLECKAALAHWYSFDLGRAAPGASLSAMFWYDPKDGNVFLLNDLKDHMPVQMLWCGTGPEVWTHRSVIRLERKAGNTPPPIHVTCRVEAGRLECR